MHSILSIDSSHMFTFYSQILSVQSWGTTLYVKPCNKCNNLPYTEAPLTRVVFAIRGSTMTQTSELWPRGASRTTVRTADHSNLNETIHLQSVRDYYSYLHLDWQSDRSVVNLIRQLLSWLHTYWKMLILDGHLWTIMGRKPFGVTFLSPHHFLRLCPSNRPQ